MELNAPVTFSDEKGQQVIVATASESIRSHGFMVHRSVDNADLYDAFKFAAQVVEPLETDELTPQNYYTIYHLATTELFLLAASLNDRKRITTRALAEQYEVVQYNEKCLQRLYLMIIVGSELSARHFCKPIDMLEDLTDMMRQSQDPIRALFLRHFFLSIFKQALPSTTEQELTRSLGFLLMNFAQMNRLWVRIGNIMANDSRREQRAELSVLVGMNIQRLAAIPEVTVEWYTQTILPYLAKHIELCEDDLTQEFILQSIIHTFPVEFHIATITTLFAIFGKVEQGVKILSILNQILDRFLTYIDTVTDVELAKGVFVAIATNIEELFNAEGHLGLTEKFETLQKLLTLEMRIDATNIRNVSNLMKFANYHIDLSIGDETLPHASASTQLRLFLEVPLRSFPTGDALFEVPTLPALVARLLPDDRLLVASIICELLVRSGTRIQTEEELQFFTSAAGALVRDGPGRSCFFAVFHLIEGESVTDTISLLHLLSETIGSLPKAVLPLGLITLRLMRAFELTPEEHAVALRFVEHIVGSNAETAPDSVVMLCIETAKVLEALEDPSNSAVIALRGIELLSAVPHVAKRARLVTYCIQFTVTSHAVEMDVNADLCSIAAGLQLPDPVRAVSILIACAALFWRRDAREQDAGRVQACLAKATRLANAARTGQAAVLHGFYLVLAAVAYWLKRGVGIEQKWVRAVIGVISEKHREIVDKGLKVENVVTLPVKMIYMNAGKFIQENNLVTDAEEEDDEEEQAGE
jgi:hypothetical protein